MLYHIWQNFFKEDDLTSASVVSPSEYQYIFDRLKHKWCKEDGTCPYCLAEEQCVHWDGLGWSKDKIEFTENLPDRPKTFSTYGRGI